jgi:hypothetical protein
MRHLRMRVPGSKRKVIALAAAVAVSAVGGLALVLGLVKAPDAGSNARTMVQHFLDGKKSDALKFLDPSEAKRVEAWSGAFILTGRKTLPGGCQAGDPAMGNYASTPAVVVPVDCRTEKFRIYAITTDKPDVFKSLSEEVDRG